MLRRFFSWVAGAWPTKPKADYPGFAYQGAGVNRLGSEWALAPAASANRALQFDLPHLVRRARQLARNDPYARRYLDLFADNVVGPHGIMLQSTVRQAASDEFDGRAIKAVEAAWAEWGRPENCTVNGRESWRDVQRQLARGKARDGEALLRLWPAWDNPFGFAVQVLDPDLLDITHNVQEDRRGHRVVMGVEVDRYDRVVGFWMWRTHPSDAHHRGERTFVPAEQVIHYFDAERPGQLRGVPRFASVLFEVSMLKGYREAEVTAARVAAAKMGWFTPDPETAVDLGLATQDDDEVPELEAEPGTFGVTPHGWKFESWTPEHPNSAYAEFEKAMMRGIASGLGASYSSLSGDYTSATWSSERSSKVEERDRWQAEQEEFVETVSERVFQEWFRWAVTMGALRYRVQDMARLAAHRWQPRGWPWVDPKNEQDAAEREVALGTNSRTRIAQRQGRRYLDVLDELAREKALADDRGVDVSGLRATAAPAPMEEQSRE